MNRRHTGFTLIEIAIVLIIVALLSIGAMVALNVQSQRTRLIETRTSLNETKEALLSYAAINVFLPCPAHDANGIASCTGDIRGFVPWKTLGLSMQNSQDAWGQPIRYSVTPAFTTNTVSNPITLSTSGSIDVSNGSSLNTAGTVAFALWSTGDSQTDTTGTGNTISLAAGSDNIVTWVSRYIVLGRMIEAGKTLQP